MTTEFKSLIAQAAVSGFLIVKPGTADFTAVPATAATDLLLGSADSLDKATGELVDLDLRPLAEVKLGAAVTRGQPLTANAAAKAIAAAPAAGSNVRIIGFAMENGAADDVITYLRSPGVMQG